MYTFGGLPENLVSFCALLRREYEFRIGAGELLDAARALNIVDLASQQAVRSSLRTILAGTRADVARFDAAFDRFFLAGAAAHDERASSALEREPEPGPGGEGAEALESRRTTRAAADDVEEGTA